MKLGFHINDFSWPASSSGFGGTLSEIVEAAEHAGFATIAVMDHVWHHPIVGGPEKPVLECYSTLAYIAARTRRVQLLALATPASYRSPGLLAKTVTTLDVLSGGRAWLGIGAGDYAEEARGLGIPYPDVNVRYALLEEAIQVCLAMWEGERGAERPYNGPHHHLERMLNLPQSVTRPHPPIMIAGSGEKRTLPLVARYGDACNVRPGPGIAHSLEIIRRECDAIGRDDSTIEKTCPWFFDVGERGEKVGDLLEQLSGFAAMGIQTVYGRVVNDHRITPIEIIGREVIPAIAEL